MSGFFRRNIGPLAAASFVGTSSSNSFLFRFIFTRHITTLFLHFCLLPSLSAKPLVIFIDYTALISDRWVAPSVVIGRSMYPTLNKGGSEVFFPDIIAVTRYDRFDVKTGDVVCFRSPVDPSRVLVKRIIAREGEWVAVNLGGFFARFKVPPGKLWVEGDNRDHSLDSRRFGAIPVGLILGRAKCVIWPPQNIKRLKADLDIVNTTRIPEPPSYAEQSLHRSQLQQQSHLEKQEQRQVIRQAPMTDAPARVAVFEGDERSIEIGPIDRSGETSQPRLLNNIPQDEKSRVNYKVRT